MKNKLHWKKNSNYEYICVPFPGSVIRLYEASNDTYWVSFHFIYNVSDLQLTRDVSFNVPITGVKTFLGAKRKVPAIIKNELNNQMRQIVSQHDKLLEQT